MEAIRTFVALGDSFTEGLEDDLGPDGRHTGWADRVAAGLALAQGSVLYANLAVRGRLLGEVIAGQVPAAVELGPDLVSFHAGGNDVLRPRVRIRDLLERYDDGVALLRAGGSRVLLFTAVPRVGGSGRSADGLAARFEAFNAGIRITAARHGALLVDAGAVPALQDRRLFFEDRLHLAPEGHARMTAAVLETLGVQEPRLLGGRPGWWRDPLDAPVRRRKPHDLLDDVRWVRRWFLPWAARRLRGVSSGDGVPPKRPELVEVRPRQTADREE